MKFSNIIKVTTFILFCLWFGGFLFYSGFVISNAYAVLGDHEIVGMITQRVTRVLNIIGVVSSLLLITNLVQSKPSLSPKKLKVAKVLLGTVSLCLISLFIIHGLMSAYIDPEKLELSEYKKFYRLHRIYLIISTVQFFCLLGYIPSLIKMLNFETSSLKSDNG